MDSASRPTKRFFLASILILVLAAGGYAAYFNADMRANEKKSDKKSDKKGGRPGITVPVSVAEVEQRSVALRLKAIGSVEPYATVSLKARVDGQIVEVNFLEGKEVRKGDVLFRIDSRPFEATLRQVEATLARDTAQRDQARSQERRYLELLERNFVSKEAYAQIRTNADTAEAVVKASQATIENAKLNVEYSTIRSPIDGFTGKVLLQNGNMVKANDTNALVVVNQVKPIYTSFSVPEQSLPLVRSQMARAALSVEVSPPDSDQASGKLTATGILVFVDNSVDPTTGTIKLKARFDNTNGALWPGQFVSVSLRLSEQADAIVIPSQAVQTGPNGQFVFVVKADMSAEVRPVAVERTDGANSVITKGLSKGEQIVTRGQLRMAPGVKVVIRPEAS
ncbi:MAG: efflux RND transporter periplasmic adaptor subunit [Betaproteobacteria bacterium]|nr:efflux RND transporter periplasmic adaptor subunit [Betaproteobacteria bacterium]